MRTYDLLRKSRAVRETTTPHRSRKVAAIAIYHASTKPLSRSAGRSAVAAAAYRAGEKLINERTGLCHDYTGRDGVVLAEVITPDGGSAERSVLWNAAEGAEKRKDARTAREWVVALPAELEAGQRGALACSFGAELARRYGVAVDVAVHLPDREGDARNHHAHVLMTTRQISRGADGMLQLGEKASLELSDKKRRELGLGPAAEEVTAIRELWANLANAALERAGKAQRIDARSLSAQGIDREATTHLGPVATEMERRGCSSDRGDGNRQAAANNASRRRLRADISDLKAEKERRARRAAAVAQVRAAAPERTNLADQVRTEFAGGGMETIMDVQQAAQDSAVQCGQRLAVLSRENSHQHRGAVWSAGLDRHHAARAFDSANDNLEFWRKQHPIRTFMGIDNYKLLDLAERANERFMQAEQVEQRLLQQWTKDIKEAQTGKDAALARSASLGALHAERMAEESALAKVDPTGPEAKRADERERAEQVAAHEKSRREAEERARRAEQVRRKTAERFEEMAKRRAGKESGYTDSSHQWRATPEPLRHLIDDYNRQPEQVKAAFLDGIRTKPEVSKQVADMLQQRKRTLDRSRQGLEM